MKKIFLTSGLVLCMACPAFAAPLGDIDTDGNLAGTSNPVVAANCTEPTLGSYTGPVTLEAKWTKNPYQITYLPGTARNLNNNATGVHTPTTPQGATTTQAVEFDTETGALYSNMFDVPDGYTFAGWWGNYNASGSETPYTDATHAGGTSYGTGGTTINPYKVVGPLTLTAQWSPITYYVKYYTGTAGTRTSGFTGTMDDTTAVFDSSVTLRENTFEIPGYTFQGWRGDHENTNGTATAITTPFQTGGTQYVDEAVLDPYNIASDLNLYAQWAPVTYDVTYQCGSYTYQVGTGANAQNVTRTASVKENADTTDTVVYDSTNYAFFSGDATCELDGYHFTSWTCINNDGQGTAIDQTSNSSIWTVPSNVVCTANWAPNNIELTWRTGHDDNAIVAGSLTSSPDCTYDLGITLPTAPSRDGYTFNGWKVNASGTPATAEERAAAANSGGSDNGGSNNDGE